MITIDSRQMECRQDKQRLRRNLHTVVGIRGNAEGKERYRLRQHSNDTMDQCYISMGTLSFLYLVERFLGLSIF